MSREAAIEAVQRKIGFAHGLAEYLVDIIAPHLVEPVGYVAGYMHDGRLWLDDVRVFPTRQAVKGDLVYSLILMDEP